MTLEMGSFALAAALDEQCRRLGEGPHVEMALFAALSRAARAWTARDELIRCARHFGVLEAVDGALGDGG